MAGKFESSSEFENAILDFFSEEHTQLECVEEFEEWVNPKVIMLFVEESMREGQIIALENSKLLSWKSGKFPKPDKKRKKKPE
jgi:hypothetical protein